MRTIVVAFIKPQLQHYVLMIAPVIASQDLRWEVNSASADPWLSLRSPRTGRVGCGLWSGSWCGSGSRRRGWGESGSSTRSTSGSRRSTAANRRSGAHDSPFIAGAYASCSLCIKCVIETIANTSAHNKRQWQFETVFHESFQSINTLRFRL